jgi:hypothetical protein
VNIPLEGPFDHFNAYYQDNFLLIQFIVTEFIHTHQLACEIKQISSHFLTVPYQPTQILETLSLKISQLMGNLSPREHFPFSQWVKSPLTQLKDHSEQFSRNTHHQNKSHVKFHLTVHQLWLAAIHLLELIRYLQESLQNAEEKAPYFLLIKRAFQTFNTRFNQVTRLIPLILRVYIDNENVVYCLLRKRTQLNAIYGETFISKLLKKPLAPEKLLQLLLTRYQARGYDKFLHSFDPLSRLEEAKL